MKQTDPQFKLRMPAELKAQLEDAAAQNKRSTTAEIIARLEASFEQGFTFADAIVIVDEAHRSEPRFSEADIKTAINQVFGRLLFERVGMTATPTNKEPFSENLGVKHDPDMKIPTSVKRVTHVKRSIQLGVDPKK